MLKKTNENSIDFDYNSLDWLQIIQKKHREYSINSDAQELAYYLSLCVKYAPKEEYEHIGIVYGDVVEGQFCYSNEKKQEIIYATLLILKEKYKINYLPFDIPFLFLYYLI